MTCDHEAAVLAAAAASSDPDSAGWDEALRAHARTCDVCQEALEVWRYMQVEALLVEDELRDDPIPHPGLIWWRRRILDEHAAARRVLWPVTAFPLVASTIGLIVLVVLALLQWRALVDPRII